MNGIAVARYAAEERNMASSTLNLSPVSRRAGFSIDRMLIYIDRAFPMKGVGTVALGLVLSALCSRGVPVHDRLRPVLEPQAPSAVVRGIQIDDEDLLSWARDTGMVVPSRGRCERA